jgi:hypothetical protein
MAVESDEDRAMFLSADDFGVTAIYKGSIEIEGIFDKFYLEQSVGIAGIQSNDPVFTCLTSEAPDPAHGETLEIGTATYKIIGVEPDGDGMTILRLEIQ